MKSLKRKEVAYQVAKRALQAMSRLFIKAFTLAVLLLITHSFQDSHAYNMQKSISDLFKLKNFTSYNPKVLLN